MKYNYDKELEKFCKKEIKYTKKFLNKDVNFIARDWDIEKDKEIKYKLKGKVIGFSQTGWRDNEVGWIEAVVMPYNPPNNFNWELCNEIDLCDIQLININKKMYKNIIFRVSNEQKKDYIKLSKKMKMPLSEIIRNELDKLKTQ